MKRGQGLFALAERAIIAQSRQAISCDISTGQNSVVVRKPHMPNDPYISFIRDGLALPGKTQTGLAEHLGLHPSAVNKVVHGKRKLTAAELAGASEYFGTPVPSSEISVSIGETKIAPKLGRTEAGSFREVDDMDQSERETITLKADTQYPDARLVIFDVSGDSMNKLEPRPIMDRDRIICIPFEDIAAYTPIRDRMVVVVQRTRDGGHMREWSVKQVEYKGDRIEFHPRSSNPKHKPIIVPVDFQADDGVSVEIIALVRNVITPPLTF